VPISNGITAPFSESTSCANSTVSYYIQNMKAPQPYSSEEIPIEILCSLALLSS